MAWLGPAPIARVRDRVGRPAEFDISVDASEEKGLSGISLSLIVSIPTLARFNVFIFQFHLAPFQLCL